MNLDLMKYLSQEHVGQLSIHGVVLSLSKMAARPNKLVPLEWSFSKMRNQNSYMLPPKNVSLSHIMNSFSLTGAIPFIFNF